MIAYVEKNFPRKVVVSTPVKVVNIPAKISVGTAKVVGGRTIKIGDWLKKNHPHNYNELIGKSIDTTVTLRDGKFTITDIT